ncbi:MAG TPA: glycosyl hydrolase [Elusimicrobiales bacterium]|nr:glycosyl hydrolase [Elusimicrobiales bacterium]
MKLRNTALAVLTATAAALCCQRAACAASSGPGDAAAGVPATELPAATVKAAAPPVHAVPPGKDAPEPAPGPARFKVLAYLRSISGKKTVAGQHNREPNSDPARWTEKIFAATGKYPGLWSGDFLFQPENIAARRTLVYEAEKQWKKGAIVQLMWHSCSPALAEPCGWDKNGLLSRLTDEQWAQLTTDGTELNGRWKQRMDQIAVYLQYLEDKGVEVVFRPLHEMNQGLFWWGGRPGPAGTRKLFRLTHDYFTLTKGLTNLIWVWDVQDLGRDLEQYDPGPAYSDILAFDIYADGYAPKWYNYILGLAGGRPVAIGECGKLPTAQLLREQPRWVFFMAWAELAFTKNTLPQLKELYGAENIVTLERLKK